MDVTTVDLDAQRIAAWNSTSLPIYEPGLDDIVAISRDGYERTGDATINGGSSNTLSSGKDLSNEASGDHVCSAAIFPRTRRPNLFFSTDVERAIKDAELIFISVNTPTKLHGVGKGYASDLGYFEAAARSIARFAETNKIVVEKSTVPCGTAESIRKIVRLPLFHLSAFIVLTYKPCQLETNNQSGVRFEILSNPEFLSEGTAVSDLLYPDRILIGSLPTLAGSQAAASLAEIYASWVPKDRIITMNLWSSELAKLAANALLAQRISSINALSAICEKTGADVEEVAYACGLDSRLGSRMLKAGPGFGGSCFKKDILSLVYISESLHLYEVASYWKAIVSINDYQKDRFAKRIISCFYNTLTKKKITILGFAYKKDTGDTRESAAIDLVRQLAAEKAKVIIYDPAVKEEQIRRELRKDDETNRAVKENVEVCQSAYEACSGAHAIVILTEWDLFSNKTSDLPFLRNKSVDTKPLAQERPKLFRMATTSSKPTSSFSSKAENGLPDDFVKSNGLSAGKGERSPSNKTDCHERLDWERIALGMEKPMLVFDGRNILDSKKLERLGLKVESIGRASGHAGKF